MLFVDMRMPPGPLKARAVRALRISQASDMEVRAGAPAAAWGASAEWAHSGGVNGQNWASLRFQVIINGVIDLKTYQPINRTMMAIVP